MRLISSSGLLLAGVFLGLFAYSRPEPPEALTCASFAGVFVSFGFVGLFQAFKMYVNTSRWTHNLEVPAVYKMVVYQRAVRMTEPFKAQHPDGVTDGEAGDWLVDFPYGKKAVPDDVFREAYVRA